MSDLEIMVRNRLADKFAEMLKEHYSADEIADIWLDNIGCCMCPWCKECMEYDDVFCRNTLLDIVSKEVEKEES